MWKEEQSPRVQQERRPTLKGKWESVFSGRHTDNVAKETIVLSRAPDSKATTDDAGQKSSKTSRKGEGSSSDKRSEIQCQYKNCENPSCKF